MILKEEVAVVLAQLTDWARRNHVSHEAEKIVWDVLHRLTRFEAKGELTGDTTDPVKRFVQEVLQTADSYGHGQQAETALRELGYGEHIFPKAGPFDVSFGGVTLRLTLPINRFGQPYGVHGAVDRAVEEATITPVPAESTDVLPESEPVGATQ